MRDSLMAASPSPRVYACVHMVISIDDIASGRKKVSLLLSGLDDLIGNFIRCFQLALPLLLQVLLHTVLLLFEHLLVGLHVSIDDGLDSEGLLEQLLVLLHLGRAQRLVLSHHLLGSEEGGKGAEKHGTASQRLLLFHLHDERRGGGALPQAQGAGWEG